MHEVRKFFILKKQRDANGNVIQVQVTAKKRVINGVVGGVGMGLAMLPSTIAFTQVAYFATTTTATRKTNGLSYGLYKNLLTLTKGVS
ncbi:MAG: hypothetical protein MJ223_00825 [Mycoplasmoidaceae bacterium]|nr:hypothetical protein [Mycoplasmoidaceae bacterium]